MNRELTTFDESIDQGLGDGQELGRLGRGQEPGEAAGIRMLAYLGLLRQVRTVDNLGCFMGHRRGRLTTLSSGRYKDEWSSYC